MTAGRLAAAPPAYRGPTLASTRFTCVGERSQTARRVNLALRRTPPAAADYLLAFCKRLSDGVKIGRLGPSGHRSGLAQLDCGASDHARDHRVPQAGPGRLGHI